MRPGPLTGEEKETLRFSLDRHRDAVLWKLDGLDDEQLRRPLTPSGTNLIGVVKHLASVSSMWFCATFGRPSETVPFDEADPDADMRAARGETTEEIVAFFDRARAATDRVLDELELDTLGTAWSGETVSLRWVLVHVLEDYLRHAGHMDILREQIDGGTGQFRPGV